MWGKHIRRELVEALVKGAWSGTTARAALLACLLLSLFAAPAYAGSARVDSSGSLPHVVFTGGAEANDLTVIGVTPSADSFGYEFTDVEPISAGSGCNSNGANRVTCTITGPFDFGLVSLGGGGDKASAGQGAEGSLILEGDDGADTLTGRFLDGGPGGDELNGTCGGPSCSNRYFVAPGDGVDTINGNAFSAADALSIRQPGTLDVRGNSDTLNSVEALVGTDGNDTIFADNRQFWSVGGFGGNDRLVAGDVGATLAGFTGDDELVGGAGRDGLLGFTGDDDLDGGAENDTLTGGDDTDDLSGDEGDDLLDGGAGIDVLAGLGGSDTLLGGGDNDGLDGGPGTDQLQGEDGNDVVSGGDEGDTVDGGAGIDTLRGESGVDLLRGGGEDDDLDGGPGNDTLSGEDGDDSQLAGGADNDAILGGAGDDTLRGGSGADRLQGGPDDDDLGGGADTDTLVFLVTAPVTVDLGAGTATGDGNDAVAEVENVLGGQGGDTLRGDAQANVLEGRGGADDLFGEGGGDQMSGGLGGDDLDGGPGPDALNGNEDGDLLVGGADNDTLSGDAGTDTVSFQQLSVPVTVDLGAGAATGDGNDTLAQFENVIGGEGGDTLIGDAQSNVLDARGGDDLLRSAGDVALDNDRCGDGIDRAEADPADVVEPDCETVIGPTPAPGPGGAGSGTPTGPGIPAGPGVLVTVSIAGGTFTVSQNGVVSLPIACPSGSGGCQGLVQLLTASGVPVVVTRAALERAEQSQRRPRVKRRIVKLGRARFSLKAGERRRVRIRLSKKNLRLVRKLGRVRVRARAVVRDSAGNTKTSTRLMTLKAPRLRKGQRGANVGGADGRGAG
jgi:Ca2+-binding RTX toxin-like protein